LINKKVDEGLNLSIYKENWNSAVTLSNLSFWDERRPALCRKCNQKSVTQKPYIDGVIIDLISNALIPYY
jgi:hypothetical protein